MSDYYICDACGHNVPVHNRVLHGFSCAAGERKKKKVKSSSSASAAGATKKRASNGDGGGSKKSQDAGGGGAGGGQRKRKSAVVKEPDLRTEDEKKEERKRKAEERRKRDMDELKKKIRHARNKDQYRSAYEKDDRREYGLGAGRDETPCAPVPDKIRVGIAGFSFVRTPQGEDAEEMSTKLWKAEQYFKNFPTLLEWQCPDPGDEEEEEEWTLIKRALARAPDKLQLVLIVPQRFTSRGFQFQDEKEEDFDRFLSRVDKLHGDHDDDGDDREDEDGSQEQKRPPTVLLFQLPFTFRLPEGKDARTDPRMARVRTWELKVQGHKRGRYRVAFHFRHYSFDHPDFLGSLIRKGTTMVAHDDFDYEALRKDAARRSRERKKKGRAEDEDGMEVEEDDDDEEDDEDADLIPPEPTKDLICAKMPLRLSPNKQTSKTLLYFRLHGVEGCGDYGPDYMRRLAGKVFNVHRANLDRDVFVVFANTTSSGVGSINPVDKGRARSAVVDAQCFGEELRKLFRGEEEEGKGQEEEDEEGEDEEEVRHEHEEEEEEEQLEEEEDLSRQEDEDEEDVESREPNWKRRRMGSDSSSSSSSTELGRKKPAAKPKDDRAVISLEDDDDVDDEDDSQRTVDDVLESTTSRGQPTPVTVKTEAPHVPFPKTRSERPPAEVIDLCDSD